MIELKVCDYCDIEITKKITDIIDKENHESYMEMCKRYHKELKNFEVPCIVLGNKNICQEHYRELGRQFNESN